MTRIVTSIADMLRLGRLSQHKFDALNLQQKIMVVMYYNREPMTAKELSEILQVSEAEVRKVLEA